jgi:hypothetical protein
MEIANTVEIAKAVVSFGDGCESQMRKIIKAVLPEKEQRRFLPAALNAARCLEWLCPGVMGMGKNGFISGVFSDIKPNFVTIVAAGPTKMLYTAAMLDELDNHVADAITRFDRCGTAEADRGSLSAASMMYVLKTEGSPANGKSQPAPTGNASVADLALWRARKNLDLLRSFSKEGLAAAVVVLEARTHDGVIDLPVVYARHMPEEIARAC